MVPEEVKNLSYFFENSLIPEIGLTKFEQEVGNFYHFFWLRLWLAQ